MAHHYSAFNIRIIFFLTLGSLTYGYAFSVISNTLGEPGFLAFFGLDDDPARANAIEGAVNGIFSAGGVFGALTVAFMCDRYGRKATMNTAALVSAVGGALQAGSVDIAMFLVARFITGVGIGMMVVLIPIYQAEISPPASRGLLVGQHGAWIVAGYAIASWVCVGTYYSSNASFQWRFPLALQCVAPLFLLGCSPWIPESPRWLLMKGRSDESWIIVAKLHIDNRDLLDVHESSFAKQEFHQMQKQVEMDSRAWRAGGGMRQTYARASFRKRFLIGFFTQYSAQATGAMVVNNYIIKLYEDLGLTGGMTLILGALYVTVATAANFLASFIMDYVGRVRLLIIGLTGCMVSLSLLSAMEAQFAGTTNRVGNSLGVLFVFTFIFFYAGGIDATSYVYCSEIFPTHVRSQGMAFSLIGTFLSTIVFLEAGPTALANIQWRYYIMFICLTLLDIIIIWTYFPETKGLSLEEINARFGDEVAVHFSGPDAEKPGHSTIPPTPPEELKMDVQHQESAP
ncbi:general substrate transporter [Coniophora puteana RWD-64-598 SS2]|uniref:General substrate transporter n=1 Tax=Coniophora puteana (strain RWD-64-598) TaxID=741705 RepID=A0A5M3MUR0_CONPW|nr:general substrate transporter [Coniophora puteana RWD-64-598 SS2]EIW82727.1 general substrate transporter [Coniophora puteana RWD-64-598 SS2]